MNGLVDVTNSNGWMDGWIQVVVFSLIYLH
jgi:hypothetical protein